MAITNLTSRVTHIALSTYPKKYEDVYIDNIDQMYFDFINDRNNYSKLPDEEELFLYKPLKYHLFGHFDIAFVSVIDSYKFAQRVFANSRKELIVNSNVSYQIQCGAILRHSIIDLSLKKELLKYGINYIQKAFPFFQIVNLKLNNGLLIGSGNNFLELVLNKLETLFNENDKIKFIISNSYSWSDLTLIMLSSEINLIIENLLKIRRLIVSELFDNENEAIESFLVNNCLYRKKFGYELLDIVRSHIFLDTQSTMGVSYDLFKEKNYNPNSFLKQEFLTEIEWQIKPGHFKSFFNEINSQKKIFKKQIFYKNGKTDFITKERNPRSVESNQDIFLALRNTNAWEHIRRLHTKPVFSFNNPNQIDIGSFCVKGITSKLSKFKIDNLHDFNAALKKINLSRQLRTKIQKVFHNYNNGITDSISYIYFMDFHGFLVYFKSLILKCGDNIDLLLSDNLGDIYKNGNEHFFNIKEMEEIFDSILQSFEEAFIDRFLNNYNFEELNDFKIDFNTSVTQIITTYDSIIKQLSATLLKDKPKILIRQNELNTKSNFVSINFNVFHLIEPPLVFNTVVKELLNCIQDNFVAENGNITFYKNSESIIRDDFKLRIGVNPYFDDFDLRYFKIDVIKYLYTFNCNTQLYVFWSWIYFLQNTSSYNTIGYIDKSDFERELFRNMILIATFDIDLIKNNEIKCPIPELFNYWEQSYRNIKETVLKLVEIDSFKNLVKILLKIYKDDIVNIEVPNIAITIHKSLEDKIKDLLVRKELKINKLIEEFDRKKTDGFVEVKVNKYLDNLNNIVPYLLN